MKQNKTLEDALNMLDELKPSIESATKKVKMNIILDAIILIVILYKMIFG